MFWKKCLWVAVGMAIVNQSLYGAWSITRPTDGQEWKVKTTVNGKGLIDDSMNGEDLIVSVWQLEQVMNSGTGQSSGGMVNEWLIDVAPPSGGFQTGAAQLKVFKDSDPTTVKATQDFSFVN